MWRPPACGPRAAAGPSRSRSERRPGKVSLCVEASDGELLIKVVDEGDGLAPRPDSPGLGLGLPLIARVADRFEVHPGPDGRGTELCMVFRV